MKTVLQMTCKGLICVGLFIVFGCASKGVAPIESITGAELAIKVAADGNATENAPLELRIAEEKLQAAKQAVEREEFQEAKFLADEALVNAKLAEAMSLAAKSKKNEEELRESIDTLRKEIQRIQRQQQ
jgi:hypothetical protein